MNDAEIAKELLALNAKTISINQLIGLMDVVSGSKNPILKESANRLRLAVEQMRNANVDRIPVFISNVKELKSISEKTLGFIPVIPVIAGAIASKAVEKFLTPAKKELSGIDFEDISVSQKEAEGLGIIGLGKLEHKDIYKSINKQILELIASGKNLPWRKPWRDGYKHKGVSYGPQNYESGSPYRGANAFTMWLYNQANNRNSIYFLTKKQIIERGGKLVSGAKPILVWAFVKGTKTKMKKNGEEVNTEYRTVIPYYVYDLKDTTGVKPIKRKTIKTTDGDEIIAAADIIINNMPKKPKVSNNGGDSAYYLPASDSVHLPVQKSFSKTEKYYSVFFHELVHSTGHEKRLGRDLTGRKGSKTYAFEELVAEIGAAYLCGVAGIEYHTLKNSAAYLKSWAKVLKTEISTDKTFLFRAVLAATKAAKFIIGTTLVKHGEKKQLPEISQKKRKQTSDTKVKEKQMPELNGFGFVPADSTPVKTEEGFRLPGPLGEIIGLIRPHKYAIVLTGDPHAGKTELVMQLMNAFADAGKKTGAFMLEQGGMESQITREAVERNIKPQNRSRTLITGEAAKGLDTVKDAAKLFDVIVIDSFQKLNVPATRFDELRNEHPNTIFIVIFQQNAEGGVRGGSAPGYDTPVQLKVHKVDKTFKNNYAEVVKNRGNSETLLKKYIISSKKTENVSS